MTTLAMQRDAFMPRPPGGNGRGLAMALAVHAALVAALAVGVNWRASEPEGVAAELWAAVPQIAAPRAEEPPPAPPAPKPAPPPRSEPAPQPVPDAQIAIERAKREEQERRKKELEEQQAEKRRQEALEAQRKEDEKRRQELEAKRKQAAEDARLAKQREAQLKRILGQAGATGDPSSTGTALKSAGPSAAYAGRIKARIKPNIVFTESIATNPTAEVEVRLAPDGTILTHKLVKSSGVKEWDDAVERAIERTGNLPRDTDGSVPSTMVIAFRPRD